MFATAALPFEPCCAAIVVAPYTVFLAAWWAASTACTLPTTIYRSALGAIPLHAALPCPKISQGPVNNIKISRMQMPQAPVHRTLLAQQPRQQDANWQKQLQVGSTTLQTALHVYRALHFMSTSANTAFASRSKCSLPRCHTAGPA